jgi:Lar family restriction alleviation protein
MKKIEPCPFCGSIFDASVSHTPPEGKECIECYYCGTKGPVCDTLDDAVIAWNMRIC